MVLIVHTVIDVTEKAILKENKEKLNAQALKDQSEFKHSKEELNKIINSSVDVICSIDESGNFKSLNSAAKTVLGYTSRELIGKPYMQFVYPEDHEKTNAIAAEIRAGARPSNFENRYIRKDGSLVPIVWSARWDDEEKTMYCSARDATEKKEAELEMSLLVNNTEEAFVLVDKELNIVSFNEQFQKLYKTYLNKEVKRNDLILDYAQPARRQVVGQIYKKALNGHEQFSRLIVPDQQGINKIFALKFKPALNNIHEVIGVFVTTKDITKEATAQDKLFVSEEKYRALSVSLQKSNERYRYVTRATFDAIWDWDLIADTVYWGEGFKTIFGYELDEVESSVTSWTHHIHPEDFDRVIKSIHEVINSSELNWIKEYRYQKSDGKYAHVLDKGIVVRDKQGKATRMIGAMQDITKKKNDGFELQQSEARHRGLIKSQTNYVIRTDMDGNYTYYNQKFFDDFGWIHNKPDLLGINSMISIMDYNHQQVIDTVKECLANVNTVFQVEIDKPSINQSTKTTLWDFICLVDLQGEPIEIQCVGIDITDRKKAEKELLSTLEEKNTILESIRDAFFAVDKNWTVTYWNAQAEKALATSKEKAIGYNLWEVFSNSLNSKSYEEYHFAMKTGHVVHFEDYYPPLRKWYEISAYPSDKGLSVYFKDVTERKSADIRMEEQNRKLQDIAWTQSHVVRAPLARLMGIASILKDVKNSTSEYNEWFKHFTVSANELDRIIQDIVKKTEDLD